MFYLNSTLNFGLPQVLIFKLEVYYRVDRLLFGLTAQQKGTTTQWDSNKTSLFVGVGGKRRENVDEVFIKVSYFRLWKCHVFMSLRLLFVGLLTLSWLPGELFIF